MIDTLTSELKTGERTRLAVELHDSLAQNLTGVAMELEAAIRSGGDGASPHLTIADKALKSCRTELRNALWDLRNQALEEPVMKDAIRRCRRFRRVRARSSTPSPADFQTRRSPASSASPCRW